MTDRAFQLSASTKQLHEVKKVTIYLSRSKLKKYDARASNEFTKKPKNVGTSPNVCSL